MTSFQLRINPDQPDDGADVLLDWLPEKATSTVAYEPRFLSGLTPSPVARDLLNLAGAVYCADKLAKRATTLDRWTRDLHLQVPVSDVALWDLAKPTLIGALDFLSGDRWDLSFVADDSEHARTDSATSGYDSVSLLSGGLDSLAGVIDRLEAGENLVLVGHHDSALTDNRQRALFDALAKHYGAGRLSHRRLWLRPAGRRRDQARPLPGGGVETTTRSRSFLFFAAGTVVADALGASVPLYAPENGFIGINVPLTAARAGSLSTRTTHPLYTHHWTTLLATLGLDHVIENPYRLMTKGEMLDRSANQELLLQLTPRSVSCSHPEAPRWVKRPQGNCGYCYPCLIRRAALHRVGVDRARDYAWNALTDAGLLRRESKRGGSLRALAASLGRPERPDDVLRNGRIPGGETEHFFNMYKRGRAELRDWLDGAGAELKRRLR